MKKSLFISLLTAVTLPLITTAYAQVQPSKEVLLDNDKVQVVRLTYPAGTESGMHTHQYPHRTVYVVQGGKLAMESENGAEKVLDIKTGQVVFAPASTHNVKNVGDTEIVLLETELK